MMQTPLTNPSLTRLLVVGWLTLLSLALVALALSLTGQDAQYRQDAPDAQIAELQTRMLELEAFRASVEVSPAVVTDSDFQQQRDQWQQQWESLNQRQRDFASSTDLAAVQNRLDALAQQVSATKPVANKARPRTAKPRPTPTTPAFQLLGVESRGGERFLAIQPNGSTGLAAVRLLRLGDAEGRWQLNALEPHSAVFRVDQQTQRLPLPQE
ncbi:hypothetical protein [Pseudomonas sp. 18175]|uniref:hypothetical protein n=1 Tax=Pseudomonas sp. 18175 TaxID=3390056 RepID=UPI003D244F0C